jgi:hypothetical protein
MLLSERRQQPIDVQAEKEKSGKDTTTFNGENLTSNEKQKNEMLLKLEARLAQLQTIEPNENSKYILSRKS